MLSAVVVSCAGKKRGEKETLCEGLLLSTRYGDSIFSAFVALGLQ